MNVCVREVKPLSPSLDLGVDRLKFAEAFECYHFMFLKPIDSHGSFLSLPCLYLILFAIALHCFKVPYFGKTVFLEV